MKLHYQSILIVENDKNKREALLQVYHPEGATEQVLFLNTGEELLRYISSLTHDAYPARIVLDSSIPAAGGRETMQLLLNLYEETDIPVRMFDSTVKSFEDNGKDVEVLCLQQVLIEEGIGEMTRLEIPVTDSIVDSK